MLMAEENNLIVKTMLRYYICLDNDLCELRI